MCRLTTAHAPGPPKKWHTLQAAVQNSSTCTQIAVLSVFRIWCEHLFDSRAWHRKDLASPCGFAVT